MLWYSQAGTPNVTVTGSFDSDANTFYRANPSGDRLLVSSRSQLIFPAVRELCFQNFIQFCASRFDGRCAKLDQPRYGMISISAAAPRAESGLIQTLTRAGSTAN